MAKKKEKPIHIPKPVSVKIREVAHETIEAIQRNFATQGIFPKGEAYAGWFEKNAQAHGSEWKSTGAGADSLYFHIQQVGQQFDVGVRNWAIEFIYNYYLKFVEMGVGKGRPWSKVKHIANATRDSRYMESWNPSEGSTHRPAIMMEFRHQSGRLRMYMEHHYKYLGTMYIVNALDRMDVSIGSEAEGNT